MRADGWVWCVGKESSEVMQRGNSSLVWPWVVVEGALNEEVMRERCRALD